MKLVRMICLLLIFLLSGCGKDKSTNSSGSHILPIANVENAKDVFQAIYRIVHNMDRDSVTMGQHNGTIVTGEHGTASITGEKSSDIGSSSNAVWSKYCSDYTINFDSLVLEGVTLNGEIGFYKQSSSTQYYSGYYSYWLSYCISSSDLKVALKNYKGHFTQSDNLNISDSISISSVDLDDCDYRFSVTLTTKNGVVYEFEDWF